MSGRSASGVTSRSQAGAAGRDHDVDPRVGDPSCELLADERLGVLDDLSRRDPVPFRGEPVGDVAARTIVLERPSIGDGQDGDVDGDELALHVRSIHS